jgi:hypothetical protein
VEVASMGKRDILRLVSVLAAVLVLPGCANLEQTVVFYTPVGPEYYPPLDKEAYVPILAQAPPWGSRVIGKFDMQTARGPKFARQALLFNARRQGADAVVMRDLGYDLRRTYNYIPPSWNNVPVTNYYNQWVQNKKGKWVNQPQAYTTFVPVYRPGGVQVNDVMWTHVRAEMVVRRGKKPLPAPLAEQILVP